MRSGREVRPISSGGSDSIVDTFGVLSYQNFMTAAKKL